MFLLASASGTTFVELFGSLYSQLIKERRKPAMHSMLITINLIVGLVEVSQSQLPVLVIQKTKADSVRGNANCGGASSTVMSVGVSGSKGGRQNTVVKGSNRGRNKNGGGNSDPDVYHKPT